MPTTIEQLELEVQSSSTSAVAGIDALSASLSKLKTATKGGVGLTSVANSVRNLDTALKSVDASSANKIDTLANSLSKLKELGNIKISSSIGNQLVNIGYAAEVISDVDFSGISEMTQALQPLASFNARGFTSAVNGLKNLPKVAETVDNMDIPKFADQIQQLSSALSPLANQLNTISNAYSRLPANIQRTVTATISLTVANQKASTSYMNLWAKCKIAMTAVRQGARVVGSWINSSNQYIEDLNLFNVSMGQYAEKAQKYADAVGEALGINPGEFMRNEGIFNTIIKGFGVAEDKAYTMSENLTQLGYDISSFYNISFENAMEKLQSGISGELEPLRRLGYDLSVARLQEEALALGIEKKVSAMTQAEKSELRYYAILTQVTDAQGDMARTLSSPANQLRILQAQLKQCSKALGNIFLPLLSAVLPYVIAFAKVIRYLADSLASLFGFKLADFTGSMDDVSSAIGGISDGADDVTNGLNDATKAAKKLKNATLGIDELNILSPQTDSSSGSDSIGSGSSTGSSDLGIDLPTYDFLKGLVDSKVNEIFEKMKAHLSEILELVSAIGVAFATWKIAQSVVKFMDKLKGFKGKSLSYSIAFVITGLGLFLDAWDKIKEAIKDIIKNGPDLDNCAELISGFTEALAVAFAALGKMKLAGALLVVSGVAEIVSSIADMSKEGFNFDNITNLIRGVGLFIAGIGIITKNTKLTSSGLILTGVTLIVRNFGDLVEAFRTGDWSGVDKVELAAGIALTIGGALIAFKKIKDVTDDLGGSKGITDTSTTMKSIGESIGGDSKTGLNGTLKSLAKNLGLGIVIIAEVAAAAILIVGSIWILGEELKKIAEAWQPVIDNKETVITALITGSIMLGAIGLATYGLGTIGSTVGTQIGMGVLILTEVSAATDLFLGEIIIIGDLLNGINDAWSPVLQNGGTVALAITIGTGLLIGIGAATAALGVATVATAGLLPVAIALGTGLLVELSAAMIAFCESLVSVANELNYQLAPALSDLNKRLPSLTNDMGLFVDFMTGFANEVVRYTGSDVVAGIAATIDTIIGWFTKDPIEKLADDVNKIHNQTISLNEKLTVAVPELNKATNLLRQYKFFLSIMESLTNNKVELSNGMFVNMKEVGRSLVTGFADGIESNSIHFTNAAKTMVDGFKTNLNLKTEECNSSVLKWAKSLKDWFTKSSYGGINAETWKNYAIQIVTGFMQSLSVFYLLSKSSMSAWGNNVKKWFNEPNGISLNKEFENIGKNVIQGFINGSSDNELWDKAKETIKNFGKEIIQSGKDGLKEHSPSKAFKEIGSFVIEGFNIGLRSMMSSSYSLMSQWTDEVSAYAPTLALAVDTSQLASLDSTPRLSRSMVADVRSSYTVTTNDFSDGMETFYKEYVEPTIKSMAADVKRQADKNEQTIVKLGNRTVNDAVTTQKKANGYSFVK